jgi:hypothetical protein
MNFNNLVFVSAQPDVPYFHWQIKVYVHNFIEKGISPNDIHVVLAIVHGQKEPSTESLELKNLGINVHHYFDNRDRKHYIPNIKPFLIYKWLEENPQYGESFFLHDADIIFRELPDFKTLMDDDIIYLSDTIGYIGYNYIMDCCERYETQHPNSNKGQLIQEMVDVVGIDVDCVKCNQENSGGGQYIIKHTDSKMWEKIYNDCVPLYDQMINYQKRFPISPGEIQFWTAEMWSVLWNLWYFGKETKITKELDFSWATDDITIYEKKPILHMAGVTQDLKDRKFYKGEYINDDPLRKIEIDPDYFDYIEKNSSTIKYIEVMKSLIQQKLNT